MQLGPRLKFRGERSQPRDAFIEMHKIKPSCSNTKVYREYHHQVVSDIQCVHQSESSKCIGVEIKSVIPPQAKKQESLHPETSHPD